MDRFNYEAHGKPIAEGKTKKIYRVFAASGEVFIVSKDDITAGDGVKREMLDGKAVLSTETTCNCFHLLQRMGVSTHFLGKMDDRGFKARHVRMIPIELVCRRIATGSYLKRRPDVAEGTRFDDPVLEYFWKDDQRHDPLMVWNADRQRFDLYDAKQPVAIGYLGELPRTAFGNLADRIDGALCNDLKDITRCVFLLLEEAWARLDVALVDLKIECGFTDPGDELIVADVIDNDSWRIWPGGDKSRMLDKQTFRNFVDRPTAEQMAALKGNYARVAEMTRTFLER